MKEMKKGKIKEGKEGRREGRKEGGKEGGGEKCECLGLILKASLQVLDYNSIASHYRGEILSPYLRN